MIARSILSRRMGENPEFLFKIAMDWMKNE